MVEEFVMLSAQLDSAQSFDLVWDTISPPDDAEIEAKITAVKNRWKSALEGIELEGDGANLVVESMWLTSGSHATEFQLIAIMKITSTLAWSSTIRTTRKKFRELRLRRGYMPTCTH